MLPGSFASMLQNIVGGEYGVNPAIIFNEGWLLRILLYNHHKGVQCFPFPRDTESRWFSEAQLPTIFKARYRGDSLAEKRTQIDGAYGHIKIRKRTKAWLTLEKGATYFNVLEAKMLSPLSEGLRNSPNYDQAARTVACMANTIESMEQHRIKLVVGDLSFETLSCPFFTGRGCRLSMMISCDYGATEVRVPSNCPLWEEDIIVSLVTP